MRGWARAMAPPPVVALDLEQLVEVVRPPLHHLAALAKELGPVVGTAKRIADGVRELVLQELGSEAQHLGADGAEAGAKAVARRLIRRVTQPPQRRVDRVLAHGPGTRA